METIKFIVTDDEPVEEEVQEEQKPTQASVSLNMRKSVDGNVMIYDHPDIDIVIVPSKMKVLAFPKDALSDGVYDAQRKLMRFLNRKGVIVYDSIQGGNVHGAIEASYPEMSDYTDPTQMLIFAISKFVEQELPGEEFTEKVKQKNIDRMTKPVSDDTTELGEIPQGAKRGALRTNYAPYGVTYRTFE